MKFTYLAIAWSLIFSSQAFSKIKVVEKRTIASLSESLNGQAHLDALDDSFENQEIELRSSETNKVISMSEFITQKKHQKVSVNFGPGPLKELLQLEMKRAKLKDSVLYFSIKSMNKKTKNNLDFKRFKLDTKGNALVQRNKLDQSILSFTKKTIDRLETSKNVSFMDYLIPSAHAGDMPVGVSSLLMNIVMGLVMGAILIPVIFASVDGLMKSKKMSLKRFGISSFLMILYTGLFWVSMQKSKERKLERRKEVDE